MLGIVQYFASDAKIYGFRALSEGGAPFGPYVNRNHFAGFVELTLPTGLALLIFRGLRRDMFPLTVLLIVVPIGALMLSGSRGGVVSLAFEVAVLAMLARTRKAPQRPQLAALALVGLSALALVVWLGAGKVIERLSINHPEEVTLSRRATMVRGAAHIFFAHPIVGSGVGSLVAVYPRYETFYDGKIVDHVHNDYMELTCRNRNYRFSVRPRISLDPASRRSKMLCNRTGPFLARYSRRSYNRHMRATAAQSGRFQSAHPFQCIAISFAGSLGDHYSIALRSSLDASPDTSSGARLRQRGRASRPVNSRMAATEGTRLYTLKTGAL